MTKAPKIIIGIAAFVVAVLGVTAAVVPVLGINIVGGTMNMAGGLITAVVGDDAQTDENGNCIAPTSGSGGGVGNGEFKAMTGSQRDYERTIIGVAKDVGVDKKGQIVATMVAMQESRLKNPANSGANITAFDISSKWLDIAALSKTMPHDGMGSDADSVGLYQQRASAGWADTEDGFKAASNPKEAINRLMNPEFATRAFFGGPGGAVNPGLLDVKGWEDMSPTEAAQTVQNSDYPGAYEDWVQDATDLVEQNQDAPAIKANSSAANAETASTDTSSDSGLKMPLKDSTYEKTSDYGKRDAPKKGASTWHKGVDLGGPDIEGQPVLAAADGTVAAAGPVDSGMGVWVVIDHDLGEKTVSTVYGHVKKGSVKVSKGDTVKQGDKIAEVGNEGSSTGPHLHFEVWDGGRFDGGKHVDPLDAVKSGKYATASPSGSGGGDTCADGASAGDAVTASGDAGGAIKAGKTQLGVSYVWSAGELNGPGNGRDVGAGTHGFDCSGLVRYMVKNGYGVELSRDSRGQYQDTKGDTVAKPGDGADKLKPGDLLFWGGTPSSIHHVAMYMGDGQLLEASRSKLKVRVSSIEGRLGGDFYAATRIQGKDAA